MSLFGSLMGDFDDDLFMGNHMNAMNMQMRSMNRLMNTFMPDPFNMLAPFDGLQQNALMERGAPPQMGGLFGFPAMPNMNRLLSADINPNGGASYCSSSVITMSSGPDGRPQVYQATSSTKTGPGGIRETRKTIQDSTKGIKTMSIGHHIGERSHIIEKEQDVHSGQLEERQEFINLDEEEAEDFDREFTNKARMNGRPNQQMLSIEPADDDHTHHNRQHRRQLPALPAPPQQNASSSLTSSSSSSLSSLSPKKLRANASATTAAVKVDDILLHHNNHNHNNNNNNNNYLSNTPRRAYRSHISGATPRRPLRTPFSSPLATTPTTHTVSITASPRDWRLYNPRFYRK